MNVARNPQITAAKLEADAARERVASTLGALQQRLKPAALANQAWSGVRDKGSELADDAVLAVKERPVAAGGLAAAFLVYLAREPILSAASRLFGRKGRRSKRKRAREGDAAGNEEQAQG